MEEQLNWWPDEKFTRWERWRIRWATLRWRAFLWWVRVPVLGPPKKVVFPLLRVQHEEIRLTDISKRRFDV